MENMSQVVVLARVEPGRLPDFVVHGKANCVTDCGGWCWLGAESLPLVESGTALPMCEPCAVRIEEERGHFGIFIREVKD